MVIRTLVNGASQIESLCDGVERRLLVLNSFAEAAMQFAGCLMSMGQQQLSGCNWNLELFALDTSKTLS